MFQGINIHAARLIHKEPVSYYVAHQTKCHEFDTRIRFLHSVAWKPVKLRYVYL